MQVAGSLNEVRVCDYFTSVLQRNTDELMSCRSGHCSSVTEHSMPIDVKAWQEKNLQVL